MTRKNPLIESDDERWAREKVIAERKRRNDMSVRAAATEGGVSNQTWSNYENAKTRLSPTMRAAVAQAFSWPSQWHIPTPAEREEPVPPEEARSRAARLTALEDLARQAMPQLAQVAVDVEADRDRIAALESRVGELERRLSRRQGA